MTTDADNTTTPKGMMRSTEWDGVMRRMAASMAASQADTSPFHGYRRTSAASVLAEVSRGDAIVLKNPNSTHGPQVWAVVACDGETIRVRGYSSPGVAAMTTWELKLCREWNSVRRHTARGTEPFHVYE